MKKLTLLILLLPSILVAGNTDFLPGDAFFHTRLTAKRLETLKNSEEKSFQYIRPEDEATAGCGYAGYSKLIVKNLKEETIDILNKIYLKRPVKYYEEFTYTENDKKVIERRELDAAHVFIYNKDFDFQKYFIGLKYNENWAKESISFGHKHASYESFLPEKVIDDWRDSKKVKKLQTNAKLKNFSKSKKPFYSGNYPAPEIDAKDCLFIVTDVRLSGAYTNVIGNFYVIQNGKLTTYRVKAGKWEEIEPED